ncbi:MAG: T9SS type A sorting domain-containing protein [bacterium]
MSNYYVKENNKIKKEKGPDLRPNEWAWIQRTFPYFKADESTYAKAIDQVNKMKTERDNYYTNKKVQLAEWEFAGPTNIGGRIIDIEFVTLNPNIVYAGAATGGVFKSTDMGQNWFPIFDNAATLSIGDICLDPADPNIIYVGTGEANGGHNNFPGAGVYKSTDAGLTWTNMGLTNTCSIGRIIIDPLDRNKIFVAAVGSYFVPNNERGLYVSNDAGLTWNKSLFISDSTGCIDIIMNPANSSVLLAAMWERVRQPGYAHLYGPTSGIYKSTDGGINWIKMTTGLPNSNTTNVGRIGFDVSKTSPDLVYSIFNDGANYKGFYRSTDFGTSWTSVDTDSEILVGVSNFSWYFGQVRVHPTNPQIVYALDVSFMRSTNGGQTWPIIYGYGGPEQLHVDHHALAFNPENPNYIIEGNDGGINISTDAGVTWGQRAVLPITQFYEIGLDKNNPQRLYGGTQDNNTIRTMTGAINDWDPILGGDGMYVIVDYTNPDIIYAESQWGNLGRSTDGGQSFWYATNGIDSDEPTNWSTPVIMDPNSPNILYYGTNRIYRTVDSAVSWTAISGNLTSGLYSPRLGTVTTIAVAKNNSEYIYAGTDDSQIWVSKNNGATWNEVSDGLPIRWVTRLIVDPADENIVYATFSGLRWKDPESHVFKSTNAGSTWQDISSNLPDAPVDAFAVDNNDPNILYLGNDIGAFVTFNGGINWEILGNGLPVVPVNDMKIQEETNFLIIGTHGRSMYKINLDDVYSSVDNSYSLRPETFTLSQNYPNPFNPSTLIEFYIPQQGNVKLTVYDILGKEVKTLVNNNINSGNHKVEFNATGLSSGIYFYTLKYNNKQTITKKMILAK